ncbi:DUF4113 domain-containing protein [Stenotrophomonas rhizophila]
MASSAIQSQADEAAWAMRQEHLALAYTTKRNEILKVG